MKSLPLIFTVATVTVSFAADAPKPAEPAPKAADSPKAQQPVIPLDGKAPKLAPGQTFDVPTLPPGTLNFTSPESTGPVITFNDKNAPLAPGVYTASPYTGIVVVPGPVVPDMVKNPGATRDVMPQREPELKLTPRTK